MNFVNFLCFLLFVVVEPQKLPIGTNYSRVIPSKEINSKDRDSFWKKAEEEERMRVETERGKQENAKLELEKVSIDGDNTIKWIGVELM